MLFQSFYKCICCFLLFSCSVVSNSFATPWTIAHQAPLSMGFPRQEFWGGLPFPSAGDLPGPGIKPPSPELAGAFFATEPHGTPICSFILSTTIYWGPLLPVLLGICGIKQKQWQTTLSSWRSHSVINFVPLRTQSSVPIFTWECDYWLDCCLPFLTLLCLHQVASISSLSLLFSTQLCESLCVFQTVENT